MLDRLALCKPYVGILLLWREMSMLRWENMACEFTRDTKKMKLSKDDMHRSVQHGSVMLVVFITFNLLTQRATTVIFWLTFGDIL